MTTSADYAVLLDSFSERDGKMIDAADNELQKRRLLKRHYIHQLVIVKMMTRMLKKEFASGMFEGEQCRRVRQLAGKYVLDIITVMDQTRIRLSEGEYRGIFNIPADVWKETYRHKKPDTIMDVVFVQRLSEESMFNFMIEALINKVNSNPKAKQQVDNFLCYELGLPFNTGTR